jgi:hypothetical protein
MLEEYLSGKWQKIVCLTIDFDHPKNLVNGSNNINLFNTPILAMATLKCAIDCAII